MPDADFHGTATGSMGVEFATLGIPFQPDFADRAQLLHVRQPASALVSAGWQVTTATQLSFQTDWTGWRGSFNNLPVTLTEGSNNDIDQFTFRGAVEPASTVSPLTAAIMQNGISAGAAPDGTCASIFPYGFDFSAQPQSGSSALLYANPAMQRPRLARKR